MWTVGPSEFTMKLNPIDMLRNHVGNDIVQRVASLCVYFVNII